MEEIKKPKAILFDWDNTLANTWPTIHTALERTFIDMGKTPWTLEETKMRVHRSLRDSFPELFGERWEEAGEKYLSHFKKIHLDMFEALEGAEEMLKLLNEKDIYASVVSNKTGHNLRAEASHVGWDKYFGNLVGARDAEEDKPSIKPVHMALNGSGLHPDKDDIWFIGDTVSDMECAYNSGCKPVLYGDRNKNGEEFKHCRPKLHVPNHNYLIDILKKF